MWNFNKRLGPNRIGWNSKKQKVREGGRKGESGEMVGLRESKRGIKRERERNRKTVGVSVRESVEG